MIIATLPFAKSRLISNEEFEIKTYLANVIYLCILSDTDRKKIHNYVSSLIESYYLDDFSEEEIEADALARVEDEAVIFHGNLFQLAETDPATADQPTFSIFCCGYSHSTPRLAGR